MSDPKKGLRIVARNIIPEHVGKLIHWVYAVESALSASFGCSQAERDAFAAAVRRARPLVKTGSPAEVDAAALELRMVSRTIHEADLRAAGRQPEDLPLQHPDGSLVEPEDLLARFLILVLETGCRPWGIALDHPDGRPLTAQDLLARLRAAHRKDGA